MDTENAQTQGLPEPDLSLSSVEAKREQGGWWETPTKTCLNCRTKKPLTAFAKNGNGGFRARCRTCLVQAQQQYRQKNYEHVLALDRERHKKRRLQTPSVYEKERDRRFLARYRITREQIVDLLKTQQSKCAICENSLEIRHLTHVDHCHQSNKVRGILCSSCNTGLGLFQDDPERLLKAYTYLHRHFSAQDYVQMPALPVHD